MKISRTVLKNGMRVVSSPSKDTKSVAIQFMMKTGSRNETKGIGGISHFLEHMVFKGTEKRPTAVQIARDIERLGALNNAFTDKEHTGYFIKTTSKHFDEAVEILYDMIFNSALRKEDIATESKVILEEKKMYEENPRMNIGDLFEEVFFDDERLSQNIVGTEKSIKGVERKDFLSYLTKYYTAKNMVVSVAGDIPENYLSVLEKQLGGIRTGKETNWGSEKREPMLKKIALNYKDNFQSNLIMGYPGLKISDKNINVLKALSVIVGGGMSSRLFQQVREKRGLAYDIHTELGTYSDSGYFAVVAGIDSMRVEEALIVTAEEINSVLESLTEEELEIAKERMKGSIAFNFEDSLKRASYYAEREIYNLELLTEEEMIKRIEGITLLSVKEMAEEIFSKKPALALIGPFKNKEKFVKILASS